MDLFVVASNEFDDSDASDSDGLASKVPSSNRKNPSEDPLEIVSIDEYIKKRQ
jgi:hypothetical protein